MFVSTMPHKERLKGFFIPKLKFAASGLVATALDYVIYISVVQWLSPVASNIISYSIAVIANFIMQQTFIFSRKRSLSEAFGLSMLFSLVGLLLSTGLIYSLNMMAILDQNQYVIKLIVTGIIFFYNFYTKRYAFEKH